MLTCVIYRANYFNPQSKFLAIPLIIIWYQRKRPWRN